jgi:hypothetical protein
LEIDYNVHNSTGSYELRLNGVAIIGPTTGTDTNNAGAVGTATLIKILCGTAGNIYFDDFVITKGGGFQGDCRVVTQWPSADGTNTAWAQTKPALAWQANGSLAAHTAAVTVAWPTHIVDDVALLFIETCGGEPASLSTASGFVQVANSPQATGSGTAGTQLSIYWCRATSTAMAAPVVADPGDHVVALIMTFRGAKRIGTPYDTPVGGVKASANTSVDATGITTTVDGALVVVGVTHSIDDAAANFSAWANAGLASIAEVFDLGTTGNNGGGIGVAAGIKTSAGATGNTTGTCISSVNAFITLALLPASADADAVNDGQAATVAYIGHDSDTSYLSTATPDDRETFTFPALGVTGTTKAVAINHVSRKTDAGSRKIAGCIRRSSTNYDNATPVEQSTTYVPQQVIYPTDPSTAAAWSVANIDAGEFGVVVKS